MATEPKESFLHPEAGSVSSSPDSLRKPLIPQVSYNLRDHKKGIIISWSILVLSSGVLPILLYFVLRYRTDIDLTTGKLDSILEYDEASSNFYL